MLIVHMICCNTSAPMDNFAYFLLFSILFDQYSTVKHESSRILSNLSIPAKICLVPLITMKDEIIFSGNELLILSVNFCNVVKCGIRDNPKNNLR